MRVFSHSPTPIISQSIKKEESTVDSSSEELEIVLDTRPMIIDPPTRTNNPLIFNSPFAEDKKRTREVVEIGLLSISPPPLNENTQLNRIKMIKNPNIKHGSGEVNLNRRKIRRSLHTVQEVEEVFQFENL